MIECCSDYVWYNRRRKHKKKTRFFLFLSIIILFGFWAYYRYVITPNIANICEDKIYEYCTTSVNNAILLNLTKGGNYNDLIVVEKDDNGKIIFT